MFKQIFFGIIGIALGFIIIWQNRYIVDHLTGRNPWAERTFGGAGTYTLIKMIGVLIMFLSLFYATGMLERIFTSIWKLIFGSFT
jgi:hypothetical protein